MSNAGVAAPGARRRNRRGEGDRLRADIITAASELLAESGDPAQVTLRGVAKRIGIAAPSIYRHFPDAEHLMMAVVERSFEVFAAGRDAAGGAAQDPAAALLARCRAYCHFALSNPGPYRFMFSNQTPAGDPTQLTSGTAAFRALAASIKTCQETGLAAAPEEPLRLAAQVWAALHGLVLLRMNIPTFPWPATLDDMADLAVTKLIGLHPPPAASDPA